MDGHAYLNSGEHGDGGEEANETMATMLTVVNSTMTAIAASINQSTFQTESSTLENFDSYFGSRPSEDESRDNNFNLGDQVNISLLKKLTSGEIPEQFTKISPSSRNCVIAYLILFCIGAPGNLFVFISVGRELWRRQLVRSRIKVLIWHLATADLFVTFVVIPIEISWRITIQWYGGDILCKLAQFFRAFGLYLSSMIIVCISLDRFFAIVFPLKFIGGMKRVRSMLACAWTFSFLFATPQFLVFSEQTHPLYPSFLLCSNSHYFVSLNKEIVYNLSSLVVMYFAPLLVIIVTYAMVVCTIAKKSREHHQDCVPRNGSYQLRRSDNAINIKRAKRKTLWLSMIIVTVFLICWTPYVSTTLWYMFDYETADTMIDSQIHEALFVTAVSNSCVNPILYGNYMKKYWKIIRKAACRPQTNSTSSSCLVPRGGTRHENRICRDKTITYRCTNPNFHYALSSHCNRSLTQAPTVTILLKDYSACPYLGQNTTKAAATIVTSGNSENNWLL